ncbi:hypothetical protein ABS212_18220, partial [Acinetobacter baumannii]
RRITTTSLEIQLKLKNRYGVQRTLTLNLQDEVLLKFDSSLIPSYKNEEEFILWLADFIDRITIDTSKGDYPIKKNLANLSSIAEKLMYRH